MANRVKGITVQIGGDTTGLSKALSGVNKEISSTQKQLKDVERLLKMDPKNTELLQQKQRLLAQAVEETKGKLETLKTAEKQAQEQFKQGKISQEQYEGLQREIVATEQSLKDLEKQAESSNSTLSKISSAAGKVSTAAGTISQKTRGISLAAGGALAGLAGMAVEAGKSADDINTLAKQTGLTTEEIQKFNYATDIIDVPLETLTGSMAKLTRNMQSAKNGSKNTQAAFKALGVSIVDQNGNLRDNHVVFNEAIKALGKMENSTQRDAYAMQIFGKSAQDLNPLILGGADALEELGQEAEDAGLILSQDTLDAANEFNDTIDILKAKTAGSFAKIGSEIAKTLTPILEDLADKVASVLEWFGSLDTGTQNTILVALALVSAISPIAGIISKISGALSFLAANPMVLMIAAIVGVIAIIAQFGDQIQEVLSNVNNFVQGIFLTDWTEQFGAAGNILNALFANIKNIWDSIMQVFNGVIDFIRGIFTGDWERAWDGVKGIFSGIWNGLVSIAKAPLNGIIGLINAVINGINWIIDGINSIHVDIPDWLGGGRIGFNIGKIGNVPYLAKGGVLSQGSAVVGEAGPELLTMAGNRAIVQPLTNSTSNTTNLGGVNIMVYGAPGQNVNELADIVMDRMETVYQMKGAVWA